MNWTHPGSVSWFKVCSTLGYQLHPSYPTSSFGNLFYMTESTFEETINLFGYLRLLPHVPSHHLSCPILAHWWSVSYCLFLIKKKLKTAYNVNIYWRVLESTLENIYSKSIQQTRLLDDEVAQRAEAFMSFRHFFEH